MKNLILILSLMMASGALSAAEKPKTAKATFAGGCFWCMEPPYDNIKGVISTISGYTGGAKKNPTYEEVSSGKTGHAEAVEITYDPSKVTYQQLVDVFWRNIDPTVLNRQFCDEGTQYRTAIYYHNAEQKRIAEASKEKLLKSGKFKQIYTEVTQASVFYPAEEYHQGYCLRNPVQYKIYRMGCGRDETLKKIWGEATH